jgi:hypothetical protein
MRPSWVQLAPPSLERMTAECESSSWRHGVGVAVDGAVLGVVHPAMTTSASMKLIHLRGNPCLFISCSFHPVPGSAFF